MERQHGMVQHDRDRTSNSNGTRQHGTERRDAIWHQRSAPVREILSKLFAVVVFELQQGFTMLDEQLTHVDKSRPMLSASAFLFGSDTATTKQVKRE